MKQMSVLQEDLFENHMKFLTMKFLTIENHQVAKQCNVDCSAVFVYDEVGNHLRVIHMELQAV